MLACVVFEYVEWLKGCVQEEGAYRLSPSSTSVCIVRGGVDLRYSPIIITSWMQLKLCGHRHTTVLGDINEQNVMREGGCGCL